MPLVLPTEASGVLTQTVSIDLSTDGKPLNISYSLHPPRGPVNPDDPLLVRFIRLRLLKIFSLLRPDTRQLILF
jgi:hypothetical protein